tara:strand:+ start:2508 stop:3188 length:681 start_codon:yes stop_codon:yes gene_type:complete
MVARPTINIVTGGTMLSTVPLLNERHSREYVITMSNARRVEDVFSEHSFVEQHLNFTRQINLEYLQTVFNRREAIQFGEGPDQQQYLFLSALGMLLPVEVLNIPPNEFSGRMAAEIGEFLEVMHATVLINSFSESQVRPATGHVIDYDKLYHTRYKKMYKNQFHMCTICQENFKSNEKIIILHNEHGFHRDCIKEWLKCKPCCPNCNATVPHKACDGRSTDISFTV